MVAGAEVDVRAGVEKMAQDLTEAMAGDSFA